MTLGRATTGGTHLDFTRFCNVIDENPGVPVSTNDDVNKAVDAAKRAAEEWAEVPWDERQQAVKKFADALEALSEDFARMLNKENVKPVGLAYHEDLRCSPANAFILEPSPFTLYCGLKLAELGQQFCPPGVFQALSGDDELGPSLTEHLGVDKASFTGSTATGNRVLQSCSKTVKQVAVELGGKDPAIVCGDVDPLVAAPKIAIAALMNSGQSCIAIKRVFIFEAIYQKVLIAVVEFVNTLKVCDGFEENTFIGLITNSVQFDRVKGLLADIGDNQLKLAYDSTGLQERLKASSSPRPSRITLLTNRGSSRKKHLVSVVANASAESSNNASIFTDSLWVTRPDLPLLKWSEEDGVIKRVNNTEYGLGASVWTNDQRRPRVS
ncbi:hypothetical protein DL768_010824 [Monosporascus sp. mg162]|nr:hypothetical protein DL768_010824 [Monosporascus sp. mg162]